MLDYDVIKDYADNRLALITIEIRLDRDGLNKLKEQKFCIPMLKFLKEQKER